MIKLIIVVIAIILATFSNCYAGVKDSTEKYKGTTYIGNIFKDYDYLPEPINKRHLLRLLNIIHIPDNSGQNIYEIGINYSYVFPRWVESDFGWTRFAMGFNFKILPGKYFIYSFGFTEVIQFDGGFYFGLNAGMSFGKKEYSDYDYFNHTDVIEVRDEIGLEPEIIFGHDIYLGEWLLSPELRICLNFTFDKSPMQFGLNIGRYF